MAEPASTSSTFADSSPKLSLKLSPLGGSKSLSLCRKTSSGTCLALEDFYKRSIFADRFFECGVKAFSPFPVRIHFYVVFKGTELNGLTSSHIDVIKRFGQQYSWAGWLAYLVGDLLVLPERRGHSVYPTNITMAPTPTLPPSSDVTPTPTTTVGPSGMTKATITGRLYNFTFDIKLLNPNSGAFNLLESRFCRDSSQVYTQKFPAPNEVVFSLYFDTQMSEHLRNDIIYVLENDSPKVNLTVSNLQLVEVLHLGDLYLTWRFITLEPVDGNSVSSMFPPTTPSPEPTSVIPTMTSTEPPVTSTLDVQLSSSYEPVEPKSNITLEYHLFNFTYVPGLWDPESEVFEMYQRRLCSELQEIFKASRMFRLIYEGCGIDEFSTTIDTIERSRDHTLIQVDSTIFELLPIGGLLFILDRRPAITSSSDDVTVDTPVLPTPDPTSLLTMASSGYNGVKIILYYEVYKLNYTSDLENPKSPRFQQHLRRVSNPEGVTFTLTLRTFLLENIAKHVRTFLEVAAPDVYVPGYRLLEVGDLLLIMDRFIINVTVTDLPSDSPTPSPSPTMTLSSISMTSTPEPSPTSSVPEPSSSIDPYLWSFLSFQFGLADFTFTEDLNYAVSGRYQNLQRKFCQDIQRYYAASPLAAYYRNCRIDQFIEPPNPNVRPKVTFTFMFEIPYSKAVDDMVVETLLYTPPRVDIDGAKTLHVGDLYLIIETFTQVIPGPDGSSLKSYWTPTTLYFRMSFEVLNMTWTSGLGNNKSSIFRFYNVNFCRQ
ncbi:hypothetical protein BaRGS_00028300, partial [Batillaria attramentaria]